MSRPKIISQSCLMTVLILLSELASGQKVFTDVTELAGIDHWFEVFQGTFGGGAAVIDFDQDGWEDVFLASGAGADQLLRNVGNGTFEDMTSSAGLSILENFVTQGACVADVNKDGWPDLFVTTISHVRGENFALAPNMLFLNNQGVFIEVAEQYGLAESTFSTSASFGDVNKDGYPDLYVCNYFKNFNGSLDRFHGPQADGDTEPAKDLLYINHGGKRFVEVSEQYGIKKQGLTFQALWSDVDNDKDLDILVANDFGYRGTTNLLYINEFPRSSFREVSSEKGFNWGINAMGIGACDVNMDGLLDYKITNIQISPFLINQGSSKPFVEDSKNLGTAFATVRADGGVRVTPYSWGINFFDADHDMDSDLYITNGCLNPQLAPNPNLLLENENGVFSDKGFVSRTNDHSIGRGSVVFDYDHDGDLDLLVINQRPYSDEDIGLKFLSTRLFRNDLNSPNNWLQLKLKGKQSESNGIGSRIELYVEDQMLLREIYGGSSHESQNTLLAHFGLAHHTSIDSVIIFWSGGNEQKLESVGVNQVLEIEEQMIINEQDAGSINIFPNAFATDVTLQFQLPQAQNYSILLFDNQGKKISEIINNAYGARGTLTYSSANAIPAGVYYFVLHTSEANYVCSGVKK